MNILEELKLSKKQNNDKRYEYLCQNFNVVDYAIKLEKYTIKLQRENKILKENKQLQERIEYLERSNNRREGAITEQYHEIVGLETRWNKLKEYIKETKLKEFEKSYGKRYGKTFTQAEIVVCNMILDKTQELQGSDE